MFISMYYYSALFDLFTSFISLHRYYQQINVAVMNNLFIVAVVYASNCVPTYVQNHLSSTDISNTLIDGSVHMLVTVLDLIINICNLFRYPTGLLLH